MGVCPWTRSYQQRSSFQIYKSDLRWPLRGLPAHTVCFFIKASWRRFTRPLSFHRLKSSCTTLPTTLVQTTIRIKKTMENFNLTMDLGFAPESLFETDQYVFGDGPITTNENNLANTKTSKQHEAFDNFVKGSVEDFMDFELDLRSDSMLSFFEMEQIKEVKPDPQMTRPSVIMSKPRQSMQAQPILTDIMADCGITSNLPEYCVTDDSNFSISSPSSIHSDMELEKNQELIDELEEFFIKVDGTPTIVDEKIEPLSPPDSSPDQILSALTSGKVMEDNNTLTTSVVSEDGQNVIIIIAPNSPPECESFLEPVSPTTQLQSPTSPTATNDSDCSYDTDPEWSPSPASNTSFATQLFSPPEQTKLRKKYARSRPPQAPIGPYPVEKKERKKAQNRTAAFRYREKKKSEQDVIDEELELLATKNNVLKEKLMIEAGLGRYAQTVRI